MNHHALTFLILELNHLLDSGKYDSISVRDIQQRIDDGTVLRFLRERGGEDIDLSLLLDVRTYGDFESFYVRHLQALYDAYSGKERRKWGVENKGICLLLAWTNEILQQGTGWRPNDNVASRA